jgi:DNA-binding XRE family transcriptional regulator
MREDKRKRPEAKAWKVEWVKDLLGLSDDGVAYVALKLKLGRSVKVKRRERRLTQTALARKIGSSHSRVAEMEAGDPTVSLDLLIRSLLALGASNRELAKIITSRLVAGTT